MIFGDEMCIFFVKWGRNVILKFYVGQRVVLWFGEEQNYQFLSCLLPPVCPVFETVLQIKHRTTEVVRSFSFVF